MHPDSRVGQSEGNMRNHYGYLVLKGCKMIPCLGSAILEKHGFFIKNRFFTLFLILCFSSKMHWGCSIVYKN